MTPPGLLVLQAYSLPDAWAKAIRTVMAQGQILENENGIKAKEMTSLIEITHPLAEPQLHPQFPTREKHLKEYLRQWEKGYDWQKQGFTYNYRDRFVKYGNPFLPTNQLARISNRIKNDLSRRNQMITWMPEIDLNNDETPCLQRVWLRNLGNGTIDLHCTWRSRDLYNAWNSNYIGLLRMVCKEILEPNNLRLARLVDFCDSLHIYEADWDAASRVKILPLNPQEAYR